ncbi:uncharacterized protein LOC143468948 [Clavelina lepadiformis]|uniref:uncharacterized protein LOC143468948 n=1 Tax=Clavelina lepadiformis TaxID=159417 RepID=UPI0040432053
MAAVETSQDWEKDLDWLIKDSEEQVMKEDTAKSEMNAKNAAESTAVAEPIEQIEDTGHQQEPNTVLKDDSDTDEEDDDEDDGLTPDERFLLQHNTSLNDAVEGDEYDVLTRLAKANEELASEPADEEERERKVLFKQKLVDFEAPPNDFSSSSSETETKMGDISKDMNDLKLQSTDSVEINGQVLHKDEKVLVERGGKFELVEAGELNGMLPTSAWSNPQQNGLSYESERRSFQSPKQRPKSAPARHSQPSYSLPPAKPSVAKTFCYSPEMKVLLNKQAAARAARTKEEERRIQAEKQLNREEAEDAWKSWLERKNESIRKQKKQDKEEHLKKEMETEKFPEEAEEAYQSWLKQKRIQAKKEKVMIQQQQIEIDEGWFMRERKDCNKAFRQWLQNKNRMARKAKEEEKQLKKQSIREMRRARKVQKLMASIQEAQQMKYVEYYGYRV